MKIGITAASGKLGEAVIQELLKEVDKDDIIAIARTPKNAQHLGVEIRKGDYNSPEEFDVALKGVDAVLLVSGMDEPQKRIIQHRNVIAAAKKPYSGTYISNKTMVIVAPITDTKAPSLVLLFSLYQILRLKNMPRKRLAKSSIGTMVRPSGC